MKRSLFIALACVSVAGCTLEEPADVGVYCDNHIGIKLSSGKLCSRDAENRCEGCSKADIETCESYVRSKVFEMNACPHDFSCLQPTGEESTNICAHSLAKACTLDKPYMCVSEDDESVNRCASSCDMCEKDETCYIVVGSESEDEENTEKEQAECQNGMTKCDGDNLHICASGKWMDKEKCALGCDQGACNKPIVRVCIEGEKRCEEDKIQVCKENKWEDHETCELGCSGIACNECTDGSMHCASESIKQTCVGGMWGESEVCTNGCSEGVCNAANLGAACEASTYQQTCFNDNANALVCRGGKVTQLRCANHDCAPGSGLEVSCSESCTYDSVYECAPACNSDRSVGYYYSSGKVNKITCEKNDCAVVDGYVACNNAPNCTATTKSKSNCVPSCSEDGKTGYYMSLSGNLHKLSCPNADCTKVGTYLYCGAQEACARDSYVPTCLDKNTNQGLYCSSDEIVKTFTCPTGYCKIKTDGTCEGSPRCVDNHYNIVDYPQGFVDCVADPSAPPPANTCQYGIDPMRCNGKERQACGSNGIYYTVDTCDDGYQCVDDPSDSYYVECYPDKVMVDCKHEDSPAICDGNDMYVCGSKNKYYRAVPCDSNSYCQVNYNGYGSCIPNEIPKSCTYSKDPAYCKGRTVYVCVNDGPNTPGIYNPFKTCSSNEVCHVFEDGYGACVSDVVAGSCKVGSPDVCYNSAGYSCNNGSYEWYRSCDWKHECVVGKSSGNAYCVPKGAGGTCTPGESPAMCDGNMLYFCNNDKQYSIGAVCGNNKKCVVFDSGYGECVDSSFEITCKKGESPAYCNDKRLYLCGKENRYYFSQYCSKGCKVNSNGYGECL